METMKQSGLWSSLGTHGSLVVIWWLCISGSGETRNKGQSPPKTVGILTNVFCTPGPNLVILAWMGDELCCGQARNGVNLDFDLIFDLEGQDRLLLKTIGTLTKLLCTFWPNLVILAWRDFRVIAQTSKWLTHRLTHTRTHTHTDAGNDNTWWPKLASGKNENSYQSIHNQGAIYGD